MRPIIQIVAEEVDYNTGFGFSIRNATWAMRSLHFPAHATVDVLFAFDELEPPDFGREMPYIIRLVTPDGNWVDAVSKVETIPFQQPGRPFVFTIQERLALTVNPGVHEFHLLLGAQQRSVGMARVLFEHATP
jgi:hypothetical protein